MSLDPDGKYLAEASGVSVFDHRHVAVHLTMADYRLGEAVPGAPEYAVAMILSSEQARELARSLLAKADIADFGKPPSSARQ